MKFFKLLNILILNNIKEEKFLTFLSVIGIALGIGLFTGVKVASDRAIASFEADIKGINPHANYEILDMSGIDFNEQVYRDVRTLEENSLPVLKTFGYLSDLKDTIDINGIYTVKATQLLELSQNNPATPPIPPLVREDKEWSEKGGKGVFLYKKYDFEKFYTEMNGILITKKFSQKYSLKKGDVLKALLYDRGYTLKIIDRC